ncbi:MAG TPA: hypothetical protein VMS62_03595, partial [Gemmatimonadales bacterium]|nr:hypothetical protein [Gemmatimonadales bacterium]
MTPAAPLPAPDSRLLTTMNGDLPSGGVSTAGSTLPEDLLREASHRLGIVSLASAALWAANFVLVHFVHPVPGTLQDMQLARHAEWVPVFDLVGGATFLLSIALFWYTRRSRRSARFLLDLALVYEVLIALSIGLLDYAVGTPAGVSWIAVIILLFPSVIPSAPWKTLLAALTAASMDPLAAMFWRSQGVETPSMPAIFVLAAPSYLCAALAPVISHIITRLGREVRKAREMGSYV